MSFKFWRNLEKYSAESLPHASGAHPPMRATPEPGMSRVTFKRMIRSFIGVFAVFLLPFGGLADDAPKKPNIVFVLADDLGYGDLPGYGNPEVLTPNLDRFAKESMRFTDFYAPAAVCSPPRASFLTGRAPLRCGVITAIQEGRDMHLRKTETTIATFLRQAGYDTCHVGKWHLNGKFNSPEQPQPGDHGFNHWMATQNNALPSHKDPATFVRNGKPLGKLQGFSGLLVAREAAEWLAHDPEHQPH